MKFIIFFITFLFNTYTFCIGQKVEILGGSTLPILNFGKSDAQDESSLFSSVFLTGSARYVITKTHNSISAFRSHTIYCPGNYNFLKKTKWDYFIHYQVVSHDIHKNLPQFLNYVLSAKYGIDANVNIRKQTLWVEHNIGIGIKKDLNIILQVMDIYPLFTINVGYLMLPQIEGQFTNTNTQTIQNFKQTHSNTFVYGLNAGLGLHFKLNTHIGILAEGLLHYAASINLSTNTFYSSTNEIGETSMNNLNLYSIITQIGIRYNF